MKTIKLCFIVLFSIVVASCGGGGGGGGTATADGAPTGVTATAGNGQVAISWTAVSGATSYNIYWLTSSGVTKANGTKITGVASTYTHTGLSNGTVYYYIVTAVTATGESVESAQVSATPTVVTVGVIPADGIVFVSLRDGWNGIWVMNTDGSSPKRLSTVAKNYFGDNYPSSSPDGSKIVFTRQGTGIVVLDASGETIVKNFSYGDDPSYTTWSYNGKIYFTGWDATHQHDFVYSVNGDGTGVAQASPAFASTVEPNDHHPSISPDGLSLLYSTNRYGNGGTITKMTIASGVTSDLTYSGSVLGDTVISPAEHATWSPDGTKVAFAAYPGYPDFTLKEQIYVMNADGSAKVQLTNEAVAHCRFPAWSPDGTKIAFQKDYPGFSNTTEIWIMNANGSSAIALTDRNVTLYDAQPAFIKKPR